MSRSRDCRSLIAFLGSLRPATLVEKLSIGTRGDFYEWNRKQDALDFFPPDFPFKHIRVASVIKRSYTDYIGIVDVSCNDSKQVFFVPKDKMDLLHALFKSAGLTLKRWGLLGRPGYVKLEWDKLRSFYDVDNFRVAEEYGVIHRYMLEQFKLQTSRLFASSHHIQSVSLVDMGCGQAPNLLYTALCFAKRLLPANVAVKAVGFDFEQSNVDICKSADDCRHSDLRFIQGDSNNIERIVNGEANLLNGNSHLNIVLSSGSLTRLTLNDAFECAGILKACWRAPVQLLVVGGETELLFVDRMLKKIGYGIVMHQTPDEKSYMLPVMCLERVSEVKVGLALKSKLQKNSEALDLSLSPCPQSMLNTIANEVPALAARIKTINLSFSDIADFEALASQLQPYVGLREIIFNSNDALAIRRMVCFCPPGVHLRVNYTQNEEHLFGSEHYFQRVGDGRGILFNGGNCVAFNELLTVFDNLRLKVSADERGLLLQCLDIMIEYLPLSPIVFYGNHARVTHLLAIGYLNKAANYDEFIQFVRKLISVFHTPTQDELIAVIMILVKTNRADALRLFLKDHCMSLEHVCNLHVEIFEEAIDSNATAIFDMFVEYGIYLEIRDVPGKYGPTTLMFRAMEEHNYFMMRYLAAICPRLTNLTREGFTPLSSVVSDDFRSDEENQLKRLEVLLELKPDFTIRNRYGSTPAHDADTYNKVHALLKAGVPFITRRVDSSSQTPFQSQLSWVLHDKKGKMKWSEYVFFQVERLDCILLILLKDNGIDVHNPYFEYNGEQESLKTRLAELAVLVMMYQESNPTRLSPNTLSLLTQVASKYCCDETLAIINKKSTPEGQYSPQRGLRL